MTDGGDGGPMEGASRVVGRPLAGSAIRSGIGNKNVNTTGTEESQATISRGSSDRGKQISGSNSDSMSTATKVEG